jgi:hypothetical protein
MGEPQRDLSSFSPRYLAQMARHGDEDAKTELKRRVAEDAAQVQARDKAKGDGAQ